MDKRKVSYGDGITIWFEGDKVFVAWISDGAIRVPDKFFEGKSLDDAVEELRGIVANKQVVCCKCATVLNRDEIAHQHFAGRYCSPCAQAYMAANSVLCLTCRQPRHSCCC